MLGREPPPDTAWTRVAGAAEQRVGDMIGRLHDTAADWAAIGAGSSRARRFAAFGAGNVICYPPTTLMNVECIRIGSGTVFGPHVAPSAGMVRDRSA